MSQSSNVEPSLRFMELYADTLSARQKAAFRAKNVAPRLTAERPFEASLMVVRGLKAGGVSPSWAVKWFARWWLGERGYGVLRKRALRRAAGGSQA